jgi:N-acyl-L-homoserine lactone synthetase
MRLPNSILSLLIHLKLKRPSEEYTIEIVKDKGLLADLYKFRYKMYCLVDKLLNKEKFPRGYEIDDYDEHSVHFIALDKEKRIIGTVRIIKNSVLGLPTAKEFNLENKLKNLPSKKIVELSRFIITPGYRRSLLLLDLCKAIYFYSKENDIRYYLGCVERWFLKKIEKVFGEIKIIGKPHFCFSAMNYPFLLDRKDLEERVRKQNKILFDYFNYKTKVFKF